MPKKDPAKALADALAVLGVSVEDLKLAPDAVEKQTEYESLSDSRTLEAESVIYYLETKGDQAIWSRRVCQLCGSKFLSSYTGVSLCSDQCRKDYFTSKGMFWDPTGRTEAERWGGTIPRIIGPTATEKLQGADLSSESPLTKEEPPPVEEFDDVDDFLDSLS